MRTERREYRIKWRMSPLPNSERNVSYWNYYSPKWSNFMREVWKVRLSKKQRKALPGLRQCMKWNEGVSCLDWEEHLKPRNPVLYSLMAAAHPIFDGSDKNLKAIVLSRFGMTMDVFQSMLDDVDLEDGSATID